MVESNANASYAYIRQSICNFRNRIENIPKFSVSVRASGTTFWSFSFPHAAKPQPAQPNKIFKISFFWFSILLVPGFLLVATRWTQFFFVLFFRKSSFSLRISTFSHGRLHLTRLRGNMIHTYVCHISRRHPNAMSIKEVEETLWEWSKIHVGTAVLLKHRDNYHEYSLCEHISEL